MKKILITAKHSYIGNAFAEWTSGRYDIDYISCRTEEWKDISFSGYDAILHAAGIAHIKETKRNSDLYYKVNRDLTIELAEKAKKDGVKQFIFLSSMSVYGIENGVISKDTPLSPKSSYGISKLQAEESIKKLEDTDFKIAVVRPPMVYGKGCRGNYPRLKNLALKLPVFPDADNKRSMIYIDNLSEFLRLLIERGEEGLFLPQNQEYINTSEMVRLISEAHGRKIRLTKLFNPLLKLLTRLNPTVNKVFGNLVYIKEDDGIYCICSFKESIIKTET